MTRIVEPEVVEQLLAEGAEPVSRLVRYLPPVRGKAKSVQERAANPPVLLDGPGPATGAEKAANDGVAINSPRGTTADYLTARIARDRPDILARIKGTRQASAC